MDLDKTPSNETESNNGSDEDDFSKKQSRPSVDEDFTFDDYDESNPSNIWRKRRKLSGNYQMSSFMSTPTYSDTNRGGSSTTTTTTNNPNMTSTQSKGPTNMLNTDPFATGSAPTIRPYDHQVPSNLPLLQDDVLMMSSR
jgi:hypothetical protein